jgi:hypothetical protein
VAGISHPDVINYLKQRREGRHGAGHVAGLLKLYIMPEDRDSRCSSRPVQAFESRQEGRDAFVVLLSPSRQTPR